MGGWWAGRWYKGMVVQRQAQHQMAARPRPQQVMAAGSQGKQPVAGVGSRRLPDPATGG